MGDLSPTLAAKSDQMNADDLIGSPITITVRDVTLKLSEEQPLWLFYDGDNGKPYKPNKGMRRLMSLAWDTDESRDIIGKSMTLYRDPTVLWGGKPEGGIRISHLSHINEEKTFPIMVRRGKREHITVKPLQTERSASLTIETAKQRLLDASDLDELRTIWSNKQMAPFRDELADLLAERKAELSESTQTPSQSAPPVEGAETASGREAGADSDFGAAPAVKTELWQTLIKGCEKAATSEEVEVFAAMFDANEDELPLDRLGEIQDAIIAARARFSEGNE